MRPLFDQDPDAMADAAAREAVLIPAAYGASPDPCEAVIAASPQVELFDEALWRVPKKDFRPFAIADPTTEGDDDRLAGSVAAVLARGGFPVVMGASLSETYAASIGAFPSSTNVLHFSAFADWSGGLETAHANRRLVSCGLRAVSSNDAAALGQEPLTAERQRYWWSRGERPCAVDVASHFAAQPVLIALDVSVFDPALMPAVDTPVPGGMMWQDVIDVMEAVRRSSPFAGVIITGLRPHPSLHAADFLVAKLLYKLFTLALAAQMPENKRV